MAINLIIGGINYSYPTVGDKSWGIAATDAMQAIVNETLHKTGGLYEITAELSFGSQAGIAALYFKTVGADPAGSGVVRLSAGDSINWRNVASHLHRSFDPASIAKSSM